MKSDSLDPRAYSISKDGANGYSFVTEQQVRYSVYFLEADGYAPFASFAHDLTMFGFNREPGGNPEQQAGTDTQLMLTIVDVLLRHFVQFPEMIVLYVCSDNSVLYRKAEVAKTKHPRFAKKRSEVFARWFVEWQKRGDAPFEKIDYNLYGVIYVSCLFRSGHPKEQEIRQVIEDTSLEKQPPN